MVREAYVNNIMYEEAVKEGRPLTGFVGSEIAVTRRWQTFWKGSGRHSDSDGPVLHENSGLSRDPYHIGDWKNHGQNRQSISAC